MACPDIDCFEDTVHALAEQACDERFFDALSSALNAAIGHKLFTVMVLHANAMEVERVYSSRPDVYPAGGRKKKKDTPWGQMVLEDGEPYIGTSANDIREHFSDHELIASLGLASILNMPVRLGGKTLGTLNLLNVADFYSAAHIPAATFAAALATGRLANRHLA